MGGGGGYGAALRDQRAELRPLQNLRYQGPESEYRLGAARGGRRAKVFEYVMIPATMLPYQSFQRDMSGPARGILAARAQTGHSRHTHAAAAKAIVRQMESTEP